MRRPATSLSTPSRRRRLRAPLAGWRPPLQRLRLLLARLFGPALLPHIPGLFFFLYVLVSSAWMGTMRIRVLFGTKVIANLIGIYQMELRHPRRAPSKPRQAPRVSRQPAPGA